jgi:CDP-glucose 4,6-dehydratase
MGDRAGTMEDVGQLMGFDMSFYKGRRMLITGHTGFKGSWLCKMSAGAGASVTGYSLKPPTAPSLFDIADISQDVDSYTGDIRDLGALKLAFDNARPEIVIHMAAQPIVRDGYSDPVGTFETNVMGTVNVLECARMSSDVRSVINVTTDKVYLNKEWPCGYREGDELGGVDPYSGSKACSELVTRSYINSFFAGSGIAVSTARAGNVIGGGDFAKDRIIPDCVRAILKEKDIVARNPHSIRPYQHVLEPLYAYLMIAAMQYLEPRRAGCYNVGPDTQGCLKTGTLLDMFTKQWGEGAKWVSHPDIPDIGPLEASSLKLDCSKLKSSFLWKPGWTLDKAIYKTVEWTKCWISGGDTRACMDRQITEFLKDITF